MYIRAPKIGLSLFPIFKLSTKLALGVVILFFLLDYQPTTDWPLLKRSTVKAQAVEQTHEVASVSSLPFSTQLPHPGYISTRFSFFHPGIDIATGLGMPIHPIAPGTVVDTGFNFWGLGLVVTVDHGNGYQSLYAHMGRIYVQKGQAVSDSDTLGEVGMTGHTSGPHTHLQLSKNGTNFDPQTILPALGDLPKPEYLTPVTPQVAQDAPGVMNPPVIQTSASYTTYKAPEVKSELKAPNPVEQAKEIIKPLSLDTPIKVDANVAAKVSLSL